MADMYNFASRAASFGAMPQQKAMFSFGAMPDMPDIQEPEPMPEPQRDKAFMDAQSRYEKIRQANQLDENGMAADGKMWRGGPKTRLFVAQNGGKEIVMKDANLMKQLNAITIAENRELGGFAPLEDNAPQEQAQAQPQTQEDAKNEQNELFKSIFLTGKLPNGEKASSEMIKTAIAVVRPDLSDQVFKREQAQDAKATKQQALEEKRKKAEEAQAMSIQNAQDRARSAMSTIASIQKNLADGYLPETGFWGNQLAKIEGTDAYNLHKEVESLRGLIGAQQLEQAKASSPNGASGFGSLSNVELLSLQNILGTLDPNMGKEKLTEKLAQIAPILTRALTQRRIPDAMLEADTPVQQQPNGTPALPPGFVMN